MISSVSERVKVLAAFDEEGVKPFPFQWRGMTYPIKQITFRGKEGHTFTALRFQTVQTLFSSPTIRSISAGK